MVKVSKLPRLNIYMHEDLHKFFMEVKENTDASIWSVVDVLLRAGLAVAHLDPASLDDLFHDNEIWGQDRRGVLIAVTNLEKRIRREE